MLKLSFTNEAAYSICTYSITNTDEGTETKQGDLFYTDNHPIIAFT